MNRGEFDPTTYLSERLPEHPLGLREPLEMLCLVPRLDRGERSCGAIASGTAANTIFYTLLHTCDTDESPYPYPPLRTYRHYHADAAQVAGMSVPDRATVAANNGAGLRKKASSKPMWAPCTCLARFYQRARGEGAVRRNDEYRNFEYN